MRVVDWLPERFRCSGFAPASGLIEVYLHPQVLQDPAALRGDLLRVLLREYHHVLRGDGPSYGRSLEEALVSEGLAQLFVHQVLDVLPAP
ncbi:DUF2268 domain-containing putative Zn-dependent protease [Thioclava sp. GXIMD4216]|uniref:DUF2268 domain-containing putative Zn-dependent protease n=1 Tax=Thioclava sp. GXIMD4216 TaxID=3131929 RepID=UPI0030CF69B8